MSDLQSVVCERRSFPDKENAHAHDYAQLIVFLFGCGLIPGLLFHIGKKIAQSSCSANYHLRHNCDSIYYPKRSSPVWVAPLFSHHLHIKEAKKHNTKQ